MSETSENLGTQQEQEFDRQYDYLMANYQEALDGLVGEHEIASINILNAYHQNLTRFPLDKPISETIPVFKEILHKPGSQISEETKDTNGQAGSLFKASSDDFESILLPTDRQQLALVKQMADIYGVSGHRVTETLRAASSKKAETAMRAALDDMVWKKVQEMADIYGVSGHRVTETLRAASSKKAASLMQTFLFMSKNQETHSSSGYEQRDYYRDTYGSRNQSKTHGAGHSSSRTCGSHGHQAPPRVHETIREDKELEQIINTAVNSGRGLKWLLTVDPAAIRKVVNTVKIAREKARSDGKEITDREIYIRYRRLIDQPEGAANNESLLHSFQILQALMGGSPSGKLPF